MDLSVVHHTEGGPSLNQDEPIGLLYIYIAVEADAVGRAAEGQSHMNQGEPAAA